MLYRKILFHVNDTYTVKKKKKSEITNCFFTQFLNLLMTKYNITIQGDSA